MLLIHSLVGLSRILLLGISSIRKNQAVLVSVVIQCLFKGRIPNTFVGFSPET